MSYARPDLTVDIVLLTLIQGRLYTALMQRDKAPEDGKWSLPGGYVHVDEDVDSEASAVRVLRTKLGFEPRHIEQVFTAANANRDPRGWSASIVYLGLQNAEELMERVEERPYLKLFDVEDGGQHLPADMAFDHALLIRVAVERLRTKAAYSSIVGHFLPETFSIPDLHGVYESVLMQTINPANFRTKILKMACLEPSEMIHDTGRPAQGYRLANDIDYFERPLI
ncbi:NUDIX hydrolase [Paraburkholderia sp. A3RO-2L]|jgi:ADP-ribose pyrophosphatase YjhB (NUDIX family)|uniref:NUDIX hydrolase n=1 Tax=unclassified Paraburkholderia TaxID=2615204 RepID=UPI003DA911A2